MPPSNNQVSSLGSQNDNLHGQMNNLTSRLTTADNNISILNNEIGQLNNEIAQLQHQTNNSHPTLIIWNVPVPCGPGACGVETIPDTFDYHDNWQTSSGGIVVYYVSTSQFVQLVNSGYDINSVSGTYYCSQTCSSPSSVGSDTFTLAEGCGGYLAVYYNNGGVSTNINPNVSVTYNPDSTATGVCA